MSTVTFLEQLAKNISYDQESATLIAKQSVETQQIFLQNNIDLLKNKFSHAKYLTSAIVAVEI